MKAVLAFGDSNTWGLIPGSASKERYPWGIRWTSLLQERCPKIRVIEEEPGVELRLVPAEVTA